MLDRRGVVQVLAAALLSACGDDVKALTTGVYRRSPGFSMMHIIGNGQSLSTGATASVVTTTQPYSNVKLFDSSSNYNIALPNAVTLSAVPLVSPQRQVTAGSAYPTNIQGESGEIAMANQLTALALAAGYTGYPVAASCTGQGGADLSVIQKGGSGPSYAAGIYEATVFMRLYGSGYRPGCIVWTHGEADGFDNGTYYQAGVAGAQANYETDLKALSGYVGHVPLVLSQQSSQPGAIASPVIGSAAAMLAAAKASPLVVLSGPKYQYTYGTSGGAGQHMPDYRPLFEKSAQAFWQWLQSGAWAPLWMNSIIRAGTTVTVYLNVPTGPLVFDSVKSAPHQSGQFSPYWANAKGFEAYDQPIVVTGATNVTPIEITFASNHGRTTGDVMAFVGIFGNTNANGVFTVTVTASNKVTLNGSVGNGTFAALPNITLSYMPIAITSAVISGSTVVLTLGRTPVSGLQISYAETSDETYGTLTGGFPAGCCGLLRDSDPFVGLSGVANQNWMCHFSQAVA